MVLLGGLEIVAAGYVLKELHKDDKAAQRSSSSQPHRRRRRHRDSSPSRPRPPRPSQQNLLVPQPQGPPRPNSAPPQQYGPPRINSTPSQPQGPPPGSHLGPSWMNLNQPFSQPPQAQTWPHPQAQQTQYHQLAPQHRPSAPGPPPPMPGQMQHGPTMHYDMKTGKWQAGMLPPEMPRSGSETLERSGSQDNSRRRERSRRQRSYSSGSDSCSSDSTNSDLAYGKLPAQKSHSHTRERPVALPQLSVREHDWYANQNYNQSQPFVVRENRSATVSAVELSGASAPRPGYMELDAETPGRYRPYRKD